MPYFSLRALTKSYDSHIALQDFNLELSKGEFVSIIGESGSGKSTLLRIAAGLLTQSSGEVLLVGKKIESPAEKLVPGYDEIKLIHQDYQFFPNTTVEENITRPLLNYEEGYRKQRVAHLLDRLGLTPYKDRLPKQLSGGQQQKVAIAQALAVEPEVLLLDEPLAGMGAAEAETMVALLQALKKDHAMLLVEHDMDAVFALADVLTVMVNGTVIASGTPEAIRSDAKVQAAYLGETTP